MYNTLQIIFQNNPIISTYLIIGFVISFIVPFAVKFRTITPPSFKSIILGILFKLMMILFYPIIIIVVLVYKLFSKPKAQLYIPFDFTDIESNDDGYLYFNRIAGAGTITCNECNNKESAVGFLHGYNKNGDCGTNGYQCQNCGKFDKITSNRGIKPIVHTLQMWRDIKKCRTYILPKLQKC